jgi:hypothetical protein
VRESESERDTVRESERVVPSKRERERVCVERESDSAANENSSSMGWEHIACGVQLAAL